MLTCRYPTLMLATVLALVLSATGCSTSHIDSIPQWAGGEPPGTPQRLASEMEFPPVNDRPPPRETKPIAVEEQVKLEKQLAAARDVQAKKAEQMKKDRASMLANMPKPKPAPAPAKTYPENTPTN